MPEALLGAGATALSYRALSELLLGSAQSLAGLGVRESNRVALVTANGPVAATSFLSIAACCGCAPLNPAYREEEFRQYLEDLRPALLVLERGAGVAAVAAAEALGIRVCALDCEPERGAGWFSLATDSPAVAGKRRSTSARRIAFSLPESSSVAASARKKSPLAGWRLPKPASSAAE